MIDMDANTNKRLYCAIIWVNGSDQVGKRVSVYAQNLADARQQLEVEYGKGNVFNLHNPDDADKPRCPPDSTP